jgi:hypothetical protein
MYNPLATFEQIDRHAAKAEASYALMELSYAASSARRIACDVSRILRTGKVPMVDRDWARRDAATARAALQEAIDVLTALVPEEAVPAPVMLEAAE